MLRYGLPILASAAALAVAVPAEAGTAKPPATVSHVGVMAAGAKNKKIRLGVPTKLGVRSVRPNVAVRLGMANQNLKQLDDLTAAGFQLVLNVNNAPTTAQPAIPATDLTAYKALVAAALDRYKPAVAVIENEELADKFYSGTPRQYLAQLNAATEVARARKIPITNGGIVSNAVMLATWADYWKRGLRKQADDYAARAFPLGRIGAGAIKDLPSSKDPNKAILGKNDRLRRLLREAQQLITGYRKSKIDYVNFHWYGAGSKAIKESIDYLERATGKPAITNEIGQFNQDPSTVKSLLTATTAKKLPYVVWYGGDGSGGAVGLFDAKGELRPNGTAFRDFVFANPQFAGR